MNAIVIGIPEQLLAKEIPLTKKQWELVMKHPEIGYKLIEGTEEMAYAAYGVLAQGTGGKELYSVIFACLRKLRSLIVFMANPPSCHYSSRHLNLKYSLNLKGG